MKKLILFLFVLAILTGCAEQPIPSTQIQQTQVENVTIQISDISPSGANLVITDTNPEPYVYGEWFKLQKEVNGQWQDVPHVIDNGAFNAMGYIPDANGEVKFTINWEWLYGKLPAGTYRIFKEVNRQEIFIEFEI